MTHVAAHVAAWGDRWPQASLLPTRSSWVAGTPILESQFSDLHLVTEIAWGGGQTEDPGTWTDVTGDLQAPIGITVGKADEAGQTQPATCTLLLKNPDARYSKGPQSPNWPYVRRGVPIRVRIIMNGVSYTRFYGYADGFTPVWDDANVNPQAVVSASGTLRRLNQGKQPLHSPLYRALAQGLSSTFRPLAYWPCEDGASSTQIASGLPGGTAMTLSGPTSAKFAQSSVFACSAPLPQPNGSTWNGTIPASTAGSDNILRFLMSVPAGGAVDATVIARMYCTGGSVTQLDLVYATGGSLKLIGYDASGVQVLASGFAALLVDGTPVRVTMEMRTSGSNILWEVGTLGLGNSTAFGQFGTVAGTVGKATQAIINPDGHLTDTAIGHITYQSVGTNSQDILPQLNAWPAEPATARLARLCSEQGDAINISAPGDILLGTQGIDTYINILREAELADGGVLYDGVGPGLSYIPRAARENLPAALTLDATAGDLSGPTQPLDDDRLTVNSFTATRKGGSSYTYTDTTSAMSVDNIGTYPDSRTVNVADDTNLPDYAGWQVHLGTVNSYRYPTLFMRFHQSPRILQAWLGMQITSRVDVINLSQVRTGIDPRDICLVAEGWNESIDKFEWSAVLNCAPYDPWRVAHLMSGASDTGEGVLRLESDGSTNVGRVDTGSVVLSIATPSGPLWTTDPAEYPIELDIGGIHVTATAASGASSPQTFTVNPVPTPIPDGATVTIWNAAVLGR